MALTQRGINIPVTGQFQDGDDIVNALIAQGLSVDSAIGSAIAAAVNEANNYTDAAVAAVGNLDPETLAVLEAFNAENDLAAAVVVTAVANQLGYRVTPGGTPGPTVININQGHADNQIAPDLGGAVILGGGTGQNNNVAGGDGSTTVGTATPNAASTGTGAHYSVVGGYDSVAGGLASIVLGFHNYTAVGSTHGTIAGGSFQKILTNADYGTIGGGTGNTIGAGADGATIAGGQNNTASGQQSVVSGGSTNSVSGTRSVICGGINGVVTGANSGIVAGSGNKNYGDSAFICGGTSQQLGHVSNPTWGTYSYMGGGLLNLIGTTAQAQYAVVGGGRSNQVQKDYGTIPGGRENVVKTRDFGFASGYGAVADKYGQHAQASGYFAAAGDAQTSVMVARRQTTDATPTPLLLDGGAWSMDMPLHSTWAFSILVVARRTDADGENAAYKIEGGIRRDAVSASFIGTPTVTVLGEDAGAAAWDVAVTNVSGRLGITVTGEADKTIRWVARVTLAETAEL